MLLYHFLTTTSPSISTPLKQHLPNRNSTSISTSIFLKCWQIKWQNKIIYRTRKTHLHNFLSRTAWPHYYCYLCLVSEDYLKKYYLQDEHSNLSQKKIIKIGRTYVSNFLLWRISKIRTYRLQRELGSTFRQWNQCICNSWD